MRHLCIGQDPTKEIGGTYHKHDHRGVVGGVEQRFGEMFQLKFLVDKKAHKGAIDGSNGCCLRWCEHARINTAQNNDRHHQCPETFEERFDNALEGKGTFTLIPVFLGDDPADNAHGYTHEDARCKTGDKEIGNGGIGDSAVDDHGDGRRNDDAYRATTGDHSSGKGARIAALFHFINH